jgi:hypothetical protein
MDTSTSPRVENKSRQVWPHAFWSLLSLSVLYLFSPGFAYLSTSRSTGWQGLVFSVVLTLACVWSFARCPGRVMFVKLFTLLCLLAALFLAVDNAVAFLTVRGQL